MGVITQTQRILANSFQHLRRNIWHTTTAIFVACLTLVVVLIFSLIALISDQVIRHLEQLPQITVFFDYGKTSEEHVFQVKKSLEEWDKVAQVDYVSREQGVELMQQFTKDNERLQEFVAPEILPPVLEIKAKEIDDLAEIAQRVQQDDLVWRIQFQKDVTDRLRLGANTLRLGGLGLIGFLSLVAVLTLIVVISTNIASFNREVEIMRLVGAGSWYIAWPFILDAVFIILIASLVSLGVVLLLLYLLFSPQSVLVTYFEDQTVRPSAQQVAFVFAGILSVSLLLGVLSSLLALRNSLKK